MRTRVRRWVPTSCRSGAAKLSLVSAFLIAVSPTTLWAGDWYVDAFADCLSGNGAIGSPFCKIQDAIDVAADGDTIHIASGAYFENVILDRDLTLRGTEGDQLTVINGMALGTTVSVNAGVTTMLEGLTVTNGRASDGAGLFFGAGANVTLESSTVSNNVAFDATRAGVGGGIYGSSGTLTLTNSTIQSNHASGWYDTDRSTEGGVGGGVFCESSTVTLHNTTVSANSAGSASYNYAGEGGTGGGLCILDGSLTITESSILSNGAYAASDQYLDAFGGRGGGIYCSNSALQVESSEIMGNVAGAGSGAAGGGVAAIGGTSELVHCLVELNASRVGGGLSFAGGTQTITNSTISRNQALAGYYQVWSARGGGIANSGTLELRSSVLADNEGTTENLGRIDGGAIYNSGDLLVADSSLTGTRMSFQSGTERQGDGGGIFNSGSAAVVRSLISDNSCWSGAGVLNGGDGTLELRDCVVSANIAEGDGGGIRSVGESGMTVIRSVVAGNAAANGAGIQNEGMAAMTLDHSLVRDNVTTGIGGGIRCYQDSLLTLIHTTVAGNSAIRSGGLASHGEEVCLDHAIVAGNTSSTEGPDCTGRFTSMSHNCIGNTADVTIAGDPTGNVVDLDPMFVDPDNGNYALRPGSPCVDAGDGSSEELMSRDLRNNPRVLDGNLDRLPIVDLGAIEFSHAELVVDGNDLPGSDLHLNLGGTSGLQAWLWVGLVTGESDHPRFGTLFVDLTSPWALVPLGVTPSNAVATNLPSGASAVFQQLSIDSSNGSGNFSNVVEWVIQ